MPFFIVISVLLLWSTMGIMRVLVRIWFSQLEEALLIGVKVVTRVDSSAGYANVVLEIQFLDCRPIGFCEVRGVSELILL